MPKVYGDKAHVRLEADVQNQLESIQRQCAWPVSLATLANYVIRHGLGNARRVFTSTTKKGQTK